MTVTDNPSWAGLILDQLVDDNVSEDCGYAVVHVPADAGSRPYIVDDGYTVTATGAEVVAQEFRDQAGGGEVHIVELDKLVEAAKKQAEQEAASERTMLEQEVENVSEQGLADERALTAAEERIDELEHPHGAGISAASERIGAHRSGAAIVDEHADDLLALAGEPDPGTGELFKVPAPRPFERKRPVMENIGYVDAPQKAVERRAVEVPRAMSLLAAALGALENFAGDLEGRLAAVLREPGPADPNGYPREGFTTPLASDVWSMAVHVEAVAARLQGILERLEL